MGASSRGARVNMRAVMRDQTMGPIGRALVDIAGQNDASTKGRA